jgi:hypothetical protein
VCSGETDASICKEPAALFDACCGEELAAAASGEVPWIQAEGSDEVPNIEDPDYVSSSLTARIFRRRKGRHYEVVKVGGEVLWRPTLVTH